MLGLQPNACVMVEDAISGVQAGSAGNFGLVVGIDRYVPAAWVLKHSAELMI